MAKFYYNGVVLPEIPVDVLAEYPNIIVYKWLSNGTINFMAAPSAYKWYYYSDGTYTQMRITECTYVRYKYDAGTGLWTFFKTYTDNGRWGLNGTGELLWSNHDIPNGSATATDIYFSASKVLPEDYSISMLSSTEAETGILGGTAIVDDRTDMSGNIVVDGITSSNGSLTLAFAVPADDFYLVRMYFTHYDTREFRYTLNGKKYTVSVVGTSYNKAESIDFQMYLTKGANIVAFTGGSTTYAPRFDRFDLYKFRYDGEQDIKYSIYGSTLTAIADAIRAKKEVTIELTPAQMAMEIEGIEVGGTLPPVAEGEHFGGTPIEEQYLIQGETLENIAVAIQNKKETTAYFTPEQMAVEIDGIVTGDNLPLAEESSFGNVSLEYGRLTPTSYSSHSIKKYTVGYIFTPNEAFAIYGLCGHRGFDSTYFQLWDADTKTLIAEVQPPSDASGVTDVMLPSPINVVPGKNYLVGVYSTGYVYDITAVPTFSSKVTATARVMKQVPSHDVFPEDSYSLTSGVSSSANFILGPVITESVIQEYKIQVETLDRIASEVQRITGALSSLTPEQIITRLQGIPVQATE